MIRRHASRALICSLLTACGGGGGGDNCTTGAPATGTDTRAWATADISCRLSMAGSWVAIDNNTGFLIGPSWNVVRTGTDQLEGLALTGWAFDGRTGFNNPATSVTPVRAVILQQQDNGLLAEATATLFGNAMTNGAQSVIAADFNGDGRDDVVFPAHNESPFIAMSSTAFISRPDGRFNRIVLPDNVMDHDARLVTLGGSQKILARSFGGSGVGGQGPGFNVLYSWNGSNFSVDTRLGDLGGMSVLAGPFGDNGEDWIIAGGAAAGLGVPWSSTNPMQTYAYRYAGGVVATPPLLLPKPYFNDKPEYAAFESLWDPHSKTHTSRLWRSDLNQDGLPDILAGQEIWGPTKGGQAAVFQLLINRGGMSFSDETDALRPEIEKIAPGIDYSVRLVATDASGIDTMFLSNYLLVNDGTGRLYAALHGEFDAMRQQVLNHAQSNLPSSQSTGGLFGFFPYRTKDGRINFAAMISYRNRGSNQDLGHVFVNVPLGINLATDFRRDITVATRNGSKNIRTFAGNDMIFRALGDPDCRIDGGLGNNVVVYPGRRADWVLARSGTTITVRPAGTTSGTDTLTRIQTARFDDQTLELNSLP